ncbi:MAG: type II toxin-antitoxin system HicB family antitoxin [Turicibacter sp.]|nr:type II toxin-antitoxin system HicB family antitoxin [Turicibacter sp.]
MKNAKYYMSLPYTTIIEPTEDESGFYYVGRIMEFDGCMTDGDTKEETLQNLQEAMEGWIETKLDHGFPIPPPAQRPDLGGNFLLKLPQILLDTLLQKANAEGISLNQYAIQKLSQ